jgi:lipopolysaccharide/colanic/teichoic acid biosynthesis glycosyltransferase
MQNDSKDGERSARAPHNRQIITDGMPGPHRPGYLPFKSAFEWTIALAIFVCVAPLIAALWVLVKLTSPGPGFYKQTRLGKDGRSYEMYKLRSMSRNAEAGTGAVWSRPGDARVTPLGRVLRDTHLDELPQLWNILRGDMCLIGPRPERPEIARKIERVLPHYRDRLQVKPGLTGFAQIQHGADSDLDHVRRKLMYDLYYIHEMSPMVDIRIAIGTVMYFLGNLFHALHKTAVGSYESDFQRKAETMEKQMPIPDDAPIIGTSN